MVQLGDNCKVSRNVAGEANFTGSLSISECAVSKTVCTATCIHKLIGTTWILVNIHQANDGVDVISTHTSKIMLQLYSE